MQISEILTQKGTYREKCTKMYLLLKNILNLNLLHKVASGVGGNDKL